MLKRHVDAAKDAAAYHQIGFAEFCLNGTQTLWDPLVICGIIGKPKFELFLGGLSEGEAALKRKIEVLLLRRFYLPTVKTRELEGKCCCDKFDRFLPNPWSLMTSK